MDVPKCAKIVRKMRQGSMKETQNSGLYANNFRNRDFNENNLHDLTKISQIYTAPTPVV